MENSIVFALNILVLCCSFINAEKSLSTDAISKPPSCGSNIYCYGPILDTVQMAGIYHDSKTFVDMKLRQSPNQTVLNFVNFTKINSNPTKLQIKQFVEDNFEESGQEFEAWHPNDWIENPSFLTGVNDLQYRDWCSDLNKLWKILGRKMKDDVKVNKDRYSIIYVPNPVIVPGGRFREFYYWDSYWIIKGLLLSEMTQTAKGMLDNFLSIVREYGFIPNGGRIYYAMRSQPPLLIPMIKAYIEHTKDKEFLVNNIATMEAEFNFWLTNRTETRVIDGVTYRLAVYRDASSGPRPESYKEDVMTAQFFKTEREKHEYYSELKSAAESGWDFSSRWFISNGTSEGNLTDLHTRSIIPVDLNAFLYWNARTLEEFFTELNNTAKSSHYGRIANKWLEAVNKILWQEDVGTWLDYDLINNKSRNYFYPSNIAPLWTGCYDINRKDEIVSKVMKYLEKSTVFNNSGGIPTTLQYSGEQWDYPNAWPPLQYIMIMSLNSTNNDYAERLAYELADIWVRSNYKAYKETAAMYEKYDASIMGGHGGGGEYDIQIGFGWTNGVIMELLYKYGNTLRANNPFVMRPEDFESEKSFALPTPRHMSGGGSPLLTGLLVIAVSLAAGFIGMFIYKKRSLHSDLWTRAKSRGQYTELRNIHKRSGGLRTQR